MHHKLRLLLPTELREHYVKLIASPTPVNKLNSFHSLERTGPEVFVKREDKTDSVYGGNKVRNLEFLLGDAIAKQKRKILATAPLGSNFTAALATHARRVGLDPEIFHFIPERSHQIQRHAQFTAENAKLRVHRGGKYLGASVAFSRMTFNRLSDPETYAVPTGGSSPLGALGHVNAAFELATQVAKGDIPEPQTLIVGAGTCGTLAGLWVGLKLSGLNTRLIGIRCVDPIICNSNRVARIASGILRLLGRPENVHASQIEILDPGSVRYGAEIPEAQALIEKFKADDHLTLDTTYTTKVIRSLQTLSSQMSRKERILYWHTYGGSALSANTLSSAFPKSTPFAASTFPEMIAMGPN